MRFSRFRATGELHGRQNLTCKHSCSTCANVCLIASVAGCHVSSRRALCGRRRRADARDPRRLGSRSMDNASMPRDGMYTTSEAAQQVCADLRSRDVQRVSAASDLSSACPHAIAGGASLLGMAMWHGGAAVSTFARHAYAALVPRALARVIPPQYLRCAGGHREWTAAACVA